jgi:biopolymer transport protein ExbD
MRIFQPSFQLKHRTVRLPRVELTALLDVTFLLLFFVILTSRFVMRPGMEVALPGSEETNLAVVGNYVLQVPPSAHAPMVLAGKTLQEGELPPYLEALHQADPRAEFMIAPDRRAPVGRFLDVIQTLRSAGFRQIRIALEETGESGAPDKGD